MVETRPNLSPRFETDPRLPSCEGTLQLGITLLKRSQSERIRDLEREEVIANAVNLLLKKAVRGCEELDVSEFSGSGLKTTGYAPKAVIESNDNLRKHAAEHGFTGDIADYPWDYVKSSGGELPFHGLWRGDKLGYPNKLGDKWYLYFGTGTIYIAPINQITNIKLKVIDVDF